MIHSFLLMTMSVTKSRNSSLPYLKGEPNVARFGLLNNASNGNAIPIPQPYSLAPCIERADAHRGPNMRNTSAADTTRLTRALIRPARS